MGTEQVTIDLHCHTHFSDGSRSPEELVELLLRNGIQYGTISDHDNVNAWKPENSAFLTDRYHATEVVDGIYRIENPHHTGQVLVLLRGQEFTTHFRERSLHILGLGMRFPDDAYLDETEDLRAARKARILAMAAEISRRGRIEGDPFFGMRVNYDKLEKLIGPGHSSRLHLARYLVDHGYGPSGITPRAFMREYLHRRYLPHQDQFGEHLPEAQRAIERIHDLGGVAILPHIDRLPADELEQTVDVLQRAGLDGIEIQYINEYPLDEYIALASRRGLLQTMGRDDHGAMEYKRDEEYSGLKIEQHHIDALVRRLGEIRQQSISL